MIFITHYVGFPSGSTFHLVVEESRRQAREVD